MDLDIKDLNIVIGGVDKNERGDNLERLVVTVFDKLGYCDFRRKVKKTGHEIDIKCKHKLTGYNATVECKAYQEPAGSNVVKKARAEFDKEAKRDKNLVAFIISTSDFNGTALQWHEERIIEVDEDERDKFQVIRKEKLLQWLEDAFDLEVKKVLELIELFRETSTDITAYLIFAFMNPYFVAVKGAEHDEIIVVSGKGTPLKEIESTKVLHEIKDVIRVTDYDLVNLDVEADVVWFLLQGDSDLTSIAKGINQSAGSVSNAISRIRKEELINEEGQNPRLYGLSKTIDAFIRITKLFIKDRPRAYMESKYYNEVLDRAVIKYAGTRYYVGFEEKDFDALIKVALISKSAIEFLLFGDTEGARNGYEQMNQPGVTEENRRVSENQRKEYILRRAVFLLLSDVIHGLTAQGNWKSDNIDFAFADVSLSIGNQKEIYLKIEAIHTIATMKAGGPIKKGESVFYSGPSYEVDIPYALFLINAGEPERGIKVFEKATSETTDPKGLFGILTNYSLALNMTGRFDEALAKNYDAENYILFAGNNEDKAVLYRNRLAIFFRLYKREGKTEYRDKALEAWSKTIELNPEYPPPPELTELSPPYCP